MKTIEVKRLSVLSVRPFKEVMERLTETIGRPYIRAFHDAITSAATVEDLEQLVQGAIGPSGLMEFVRFDAGEILRKEANSDSPQIVRLVIGNPIIMKEMAKRVPDAAGYAPVTILIDERSDGVHLTYDTMASLLAPYKNHAAVAVARDLDTKIERLMKMAA
jgi:uncharacterized protein (DUF302 family)